MANWKLNPSPENAVDLLDAEIVGGDRKSLILAAAQVLSSAEKLNSRTIEAASAAFKIDPVQTFDFDTDVPSAVGARAAIRGLRSWIDESPRDSIALLEYARLQAIFGSRETASRAITQALSLDVNSRLVLRAATRFFTFNHDFDRALYYLRRSPLLAFDPLVQSAEIATSELIEAPSKAARKALAEVQGRKTISITESELAMALATLEYKNGAKKNKVDRLMDQAAEVPTENALAQGFWLSETMNRDFAADHPHLQFPDRAFEALTLQSVEGFDFGGAVRNGALWFKSQPFQVRAPIVTSSVYFSYLSLFSEAAAIASSGIKIHGNNWRLLNILTISQARMGRIEDAEKTLGLLKSAAVEVEGESFVAAARGLIDFMKGDLISGQQNYLAALEKAKRAKKPELVLTACIYLLEMSLLTGSISNAEARSLMAVIDTKSPRVGRSDQADLARLWTTKKAMFEQELEVSNLISDMHKNSNLQEGLRDATKLLESEAI